MSVHAHVLFAPPLNVGCEWQIVRWDGLRVVGGLCLASRADQGLPRGRTVRPDEPVIGKTSYSLLCRQYSIREV